ncbi:serine/threonine-protein phosphatase 7 long form homolog [Abrus precatorius]|uniref:Serine/threonine-protein phosphatase 7 long form homolog n=1 Tax=Abrus precatorius TaxID=3816 RepID=A0A8B8M1F8_ABRPR|nr:serine/threonine-protein phosphatase 7 long form homolog [Abrus precatorius]
MASSSRQNRNIHVSEHIWDGRDHSILKVRKSQFIPAGLDDVPEEILPHLELAGFTGIAHDVSVLLGLRIDGRHVMAPIGVNYADIVEESLGIRPSRADFVGSFLKTSWLDQHFTHVAMHAQNPLQITRFARAYMLRLIGGFMLSDHSSSRVSVRYLPLLQDFAVTCEYSWGSAVLGYFYRELCMATNMDRHGLGGLAALLVMWAWDRFPFLGLGNPLHTRLHLPYATRWLANQSNRKGRKDISYYRYKFDMLSGEEIIWQLYSIDLINSLPAICREGMDLWRVVVPLICFQVCEWHQPDRVMRQFGMVQHIPRAPYQPDALHELTLRRKATKN